MTLAQDLPSCPSYSDGRMAPWEWVRDSEGRIWKTDSTTHDSDHTIIGKQAVLWDIAATIVEWQLNGRLGDDFLELLWKKGIDVDPKHLRFFQLAYAAFRMGQCSLCAMVCGMNSPEYGRLRTAADRHQAAFKGHLDRLGVMAH